MPSEQLWPLLEQMEAAIARYDIPAALDLLAELVPDWQRAAVREGFSAGDA